jgi:hypothetical protein
LSQAASVKDLVTYYDMGHYVGDCSAWCKTCCKDGRSKVLIDEDTIPELGVFATNQKLRNFKHNVKQHYEDSMIHQLIASHFVRPKARQSLRAGRSRATKVHKKGGEGKVREEGGGERGEELHFFCKGGRLR